MAWVCKMCSSNNEDDCKVCAICDTPKNDRSICTLTKKRVAELRLSGDVIIPEEFNVIGEGAFKDRLDIRTVLAHDNVVKIDKQAFAGCLNLEKVEAKNLNSIKSEAFLNCTKLIGRNRPSAKHIAQDAFKSSYVPKVSGTRPIEYSYRPSYHPREETRPPKEKSKSFHKWFARFLIFLMGCGVLVGIISLFL